MTDEEEAMDMAFDKSTTTTTKPPSKSQTLETLTSAQLSSSLSALAASAKGVPSNKDFHFYYNFDHFKTPIQHLTARSHSLLQSIGSSAPIFNQKFQFPDEFDEDDAYDWLVNVNDEIFERFDASIDEFKRVQAEEEEAGQVLGKDGFQVVGGKKKKVSKGVGDGAVSGGGEVRVGMKVAEKKGGGKAKVPFHIATIRRPQEEFNILVNNANQPFEHVWLERSEDGLKFVHPLEKLSVLDFVDKISDNVEPLPPLPLEHTPFKYVEDVKGLKELAAKLCAVNEFAVDLEHNQYRSFQGLTCLMQISTRTEDFVVDTLKLRIHVGPYLREVFKDPKKKKVMHGADRDIVWLQKDFGIYVCNMFDTGQASRVLKLERFSLEYLLHHFCGVTANKEYQSADWRLRPLPDEMIRYAREDTHYLLHIYDLMRPMLLQMPSDPVTSDTPLVEVYKRSYDICMQLYEKELLTESSYLHLYGLSTAGFNAQQLAIVAGLFEWRDVVARAEDESTGYILPNKTLLEIAKEKPVMTSQLHRILRSKHPYVERNLSSIVSIIRHAMQNASTFEADVQRLKEKQMEMAAKENIEVSDRCEASPSHSSPNLGASNSSNRMDDSNHAASSLNKEPEHGSIAAVTRNGPVGSFNHQSKNDNVRIESTNQAGTRGGFSIDVQSREKTSMSADMSPSAKVNGVAVQVLKKPTKGFGALLGSAPARRRFYFDKKESEDIKLEKIRSSVNLPFQSFMGRNEQAKPVAEEPMKVSANELAKPVVEESTKVSEFGHTKASLSATDTVSSLEDIIILEDGDDDNDLETTETPKNDKAVESASENDKEDESVSLSDLSTSFEKCFQSGNQNKKTEMNNKSENPNGLLQLKPFDYSKAINQLKFGENQVEASKASDDGNVNKRKNAAVGIQLDDTTKEFLAARRRQAFPASGNRSATFR